MNSSIPFKENWMKDLDFGLMQRQTLAHVIGLFVLLFSLSEFQAFAVQRAGNESETKNSPLRSPDSREAQISQAPSRPGSESNENKLLITVADENNVPVPAARITLTQTATGNISKGETDHTGQFEFINLNSGSYQLRVEKEGFYVLTTNEIQAGVQRKVEITLNHLQELRETINVVYSPPAIDPTKTTESQELTGREIVDLPYPTTRDVRRALPLIPGVLPDSSGQIHVNGSATPQILDQLDGFNITQPVTGLLDMRVSADAVRSVEVQGSRYSAEFGKASGGIVNLATGMGDDRFRFSATNFVPSLQHRKGIDLNSWTPRAVFSGPIVKGKAWFFDSPDAEYDVQIIPKLPDGADRNASWRWSNLLKTQVNLTQSNILTSSLLLNHFHSPYSGLSQFAPQVTTLDQTASAYLFTLKDQAYFSNGVLLEVGMGVSQFRTSDRSHGDLPFQIHPEGISGSRNVTDDGRARRYQWLAKLVFAPMEWHGRHEFKVGADLDRITYEQFIERRPISIFRENGTLSRQIDFLENPHFTKNSFEASTYAEDRWSISNRWLVELGMRQDWDEIIREELFSPRIASSYLLTSDGRTKLAAGVGLFYDVTNLGLVTRAWAGERSDVSYAADGKTPLGPPVVTSFAVNQQNLKQPQFLNWSISVERELPDSVYLSVDFIQKRGRNGFAFVSSSLAASRQPTGQYELTNIGRDRFDSIQVDVRHTFKGQFPFLVSYTRSATRSNAVVDFNLDNPIYSPQAGGPLPWDSPNRFLSWGGSPLWRGVTLFYSLDWRDGYPFSVVNQDQQLVGAPDSRRFPAYFELNVHVERRFWLWGYQLALRAGFNNITGHQNMASVVNNIDSPQFLSFGDAQGRAFTARIRFLGKK